MRTGAENSARIAALEAAVARQGRQYAYHREEFARVVHNIALLLAVPGEPTPNFYTMGAAGAPEPVADADPSLPAPGAPACPKCGSARQVWQRAGAKWCCHRAGCAIDIDAPVPPADAPLPGPVAAVLWYLRVSPQAAAAGDALAAWARSRPALPDEVRAAMLEAARIIRCFHVATGTGVVADGITSEAVLARLCKLAAVEFFTDEEG